jgi:pimeloyl-ACP methyl ester carboxylesterase
MMISGISIAWLTNTSFGTVITVEIDFPTVEKTIIHSTLQVPIAASETNPMPAVVVIHGSMQSKEWLSAFGIELSRRGFIVLSIDASGHGNSDYSEWGTDSGGIAAIDYLANQLHVSTIGMIGHSMGAGICIQAINNSSIQVDALVLVGGGSGGTWANNTYPRNLLVTVGQYDELSSNIGELSTSLMDKFGTTTPVVTGQTYGDFSTGTARKLVIGPSNHLFETIDPIIISETVDWMKESLKLGEDQYWFYEGDLIYPLHLIGGLVSSVGIVLSIFPIMVISLDKIPYFNELKRNPSSSYVASTRTYWGLGLLYGVIGLGSFIPAMFLGRFITFLPQNTASLVATWLLTSTVIGIGALFVYYFYQRKKGKELEWKDFGIDYSGGKQLVQALGKSSLVALIVIAWLYACTLFVDLFLALDFRVFLPLFNDLTIKRLLIAPIYLIFTIPYFLIEGKWLMGLLRTSSKEGWWKTQFSWTVNAIIIKCFLYVFIILVQVLMSVFTGTAFISGMTGYYLLFLWMFTPMFVVTTTILAWSYRLTDRIYIGVMLNALIFSWMLAEILSLAM